MIKTQKRVDFLYRTSAPVDYTGVKIGRHKEERMPQIHF